MTKRLGLVAGGGRLPFEVASAARERGLDVVVVAIEGNADPAIADVSGGPVHWIAAGELGRLIALLREGGADEAILAGAVAKREALQDVAALRPDPRAIALLGRLRERGDDAILRAVAEEIESEGIPVVDSTRYLAERFTRPGHLAGPEPDARVRDDLALGLRVARALGVHDVGQSAVVKGGTVLALEALEGTDAAIRRGAELGGPGAVVVKTAKPTQDLRFDVPVIGARTIALAADCGVAALGLEAGRTLILERVATLADADARGVCVMGLGEAVA